MVSQQIESAAVPLSRMPTPMTRPSAWRAFALPVLVAAVLGLAVGVNTVWTAVLVCVLGGAAAMLIRLELAVMVVVAASVFEDYLALATPLASKALAVVLVGSWLVRRGWGRLHGGPRSPVILAALGFTVALLLATLAHNNGSAGVDVLLRYAGFLAVLAVLTDTMRGGLAPETVARVYVASCTVAAVCGMLTFAFAADRRVGGPIADPNDFAFFLVAAVPLVLALRTRAQRTWVYDVALGVILLATLGTLSRGALVGLAAMLVLAILTRAISLRAALGVLVAVSAIVGATITTFPEAVQTSLYQKADVAEQNVSERLDLWRAATAMTTDNPVLGRGPGGFGLYQQDYRDRLPDDVTHRLDVAHNTYLEISAELGIVGLAAFLLLLALALLSAWSRWRRDGERLAAAVCVALGGACVTAAFLTEQYFLPLWLLIAMAAALAHPPPSTSTMLRARR